MNISNAIAKRMAAVSQGKQELLIASLILLVTVLGPFCSDSYLPSLPAMTQFFGGNATLVKLTITVYLMSFSLSQLLYGPLSDRFGRRPMLLVGLSIGLMGSIFCFASASIYSLLLGRLIQGAGAGASNALFRAVMRDSFHGTRMAKIASYMGMVFALAPAIAPIIGGYIQHYFGWRENFVFLAIFFSVVLTLIFAFFPETNTQLNPEATQTKNIFGNYFKLLSSKIFIGSVLCSSAALSGIMAYVALSSFLFQNKLGFSPVQYGWLGLVVTGGLMLGQFLNGTLISRFGMNKILLAGIFIMMSSGFTMLIIGLMGFLNAIVVIIPTVFFITGGGFVFSSAMGKALMPFGSMAGSAGAMYGCLQIFGTFLTSSLVAGVHAESQVPLAAIFTFLGVAAFATYFFCLSEKRGQTPE